MSFSAACEGPIDSIPVIPELKPRSSTPAYRPNGSSLNAENKGLSGSAGLCGVAAFFPQALCFLLAIEYAEDAFRECLQFVFAGIDFDGRDPVQIAAQPVDDALRVRHSSSQQQCVCLALEDRGHGPSFLGDLVDHGVEDSGCFAVAGIDAPLDLLQVSGAEIGEESAVAKDLVVDLLLREPATKAELDKRSHGQAPGAIGSEGAFVDGVAVDLPAFAVRRNGNAAAHVRHNQVQCFVWPALLTRKTLRHCPGIQHVSNWRTLDEWRS